MVLVYLSIYHYIYLSFLSTLSDSVSSTLTLSSPDEGKVGLGCCDEPEHVNFRISLEAFKSEPLDRSQRAESRVVHQSP